MLDLYNFSLIVPQIILQPIPATHIITWINTIMIGDV